MSNTETIRRTVIEAAAARNLTITETSRGYVCERLPTKTDNGPFTATPPKMTPFEAAVDGLIHHGYLDNIQSSLPELSPDCIKAILDAEIQIAEQWISEHDIERNRTLDLNYGIQLARGIDAMKSHVQALYSRLNTLPHSKGTL